MRKTLFFQFQNERDDLQCLTKPHIISQQTAESALYCRIEPLETFLLIRSERCLQGFRYSGIGISKKRIGKRRTVLHDGRSGQRSLNDLVNFRPFALHRFEQMRRMLRIDKDIAVIEFD